MMKRILLFLAVSLSFPALASDVQHPHHAASWCATSPAHTEKLRAADDLARTRGMALKSKGKMPDAAVRQDRGVFLVDTDPVIAPFDRPTDLHGSTLRFQRVTGTSYTATRVPLEYSEDIGPVEKTFESYDSAHPIAINGFSFPFYDGSYTTLYMARNNAIYFSAPPNREFGQHGPHELVEEASVPILAALMVGRWGAPPPTVHVHQDSSLIRITSRSHSDRTGVGYDVQITLRSSGEITFSYRVATIPYGSVIVSSGKQTWRENRTTLVSGTDPEGDPAGPGSLGRGMSDVTGLRVYRNSGTDLIDIEVDVRSPISRATLSLEPLAMNILISYGEVQYFVRAVVGGTYETLFIGGQYYSPTPLLGISGNTVRITLSQQVLVPPAGGAATVLVETAVGPITDEASVSGAIPAGDERLETDFSAMTTRTTSLPFAEAFTLPSLNVNEVWRRIRDAWGLRDDEVDQVVIHQNFYTDLVTYAGGYSTMGNPGDDGVAYGETRSLSPRVPALLHVDKIGAGWNETQLGRTHNLHHELAHRWLLDARIREGETDSQVLGWGHPAQYVDMPAAFPYSSPHDASAMGGGYFIQNADGTFTRSPQQQHTGYTWWELYLMGLAAPAEVPAWYYIKDSNPRLGSAYYAPPGTYSGTKVPVTIGQLIASTGTRSPSVERARKRYRTLFVIVQRPGAPVSGAELDHYVTEYVNTAAASFRAATGGRGELFRELPTAIQASFAAPASEAAGRAVQFTDTSSDVPMRWEWSFGDGSVSTEQNPAHVFTTPGRYTVSMTVWNSRGSSTATALVEVTEPMLRYHALAPCRAHDTRLSGGALAANWFRAFEIAGKCGVPANARAVSANFTVTNVAANGYLSVYPESGGMPREVSTLNFNRGVWALANSAIVPLRSDGGITAFAASSPLDLIIDVNGYFSEASDAGGLAFHTVTPCRAQDTRGDGGILANGEPRAMAVGGQCGVPADAAAVAANVTVTGASASGYLRVYPEEGMPAQENSLLNYSADQWALANGAILRLRNGGGLTVMANVASTHALIDVSGWFGAPQGGSLEYVPVPPCRLFDTRSTSRMEANTFRSFEAVNRCGVPAGARAVAGNVTVTNAGGAGYVSLYTNDGAPAQAISTINFSAAQWALANSAIVPLRTSGHFNVFAASVPVDVIFDVSGYFR